MTEITLTCGEARATVALTGAEARTWAVGGRDLLWPSDPAFWSDISPILYPVVGWTRDGARVAGRQYALGLHGFARFEAFAVEAAGPDFARLRLRDNASTRAVYPFAFELIVEYRLTDTALVIAIEVANPSAERAPYACGLHPGFRWPLAGRKREGALARFEKPERPEVPVVEPGGLIGKTTRPIPLKGRDLPLTDALFAHDALCFLDCASRSLAFVDASGASITMEYPDYEHAAIWTRPGAPFVCLECWTGYSDPAGFTGDLFEKPGMRVLEPAGRARLEARFVYRPEEGLSQVTAQERTVGGAPAFVLDGAVIAESVLAKVTEEARALAAVGVTPGLAVVLVGDDPASRSYVAGKGRAAQACRFHSIQYDLPAETSEGELLALIEALNRDPAVHGVLVQLPLPRQIDSARVIEAVAAEKDVDGFHPINVGLLSTGDTRRALIPCTPAGAMILIDKACERLGLSLPGLEAVIIGRSNIVGKPMAQLLLARHCTVTVAHSRTRALPEVARRADILVAAVGRAEMVRGDWVKSGAIVIDVGINRVAAPGEDASGRAKTRLVGDVAFAEAAAVAGAITPVPGGVGRMTIAMLMANTLLAAKRAAGG